MIQLHPRVIQLLNQPVLETFLCVQIRTLKLTTYFTNLILSDGTYVSSDIIAGVEEPHLTSTVDRDLYKITLCDNKKTLLNEFENGINGATVNVRMGFVDYTTKLPELQHLFIVYKGIVESYAYEIKTEEVGEMIATISCSNLMASLDDSNPYYTSKFALNKINPADSAFDQIYEGGEAVTLKWGKK